VIDVKGSFSRPPTFAPEPQALLPSINRQFAFEARKLIQEKAGGSPGSRYLTLRSGATRASAFGRVTATGAEVGASGPGIEAQEEGATIKARNGRYLTFRLSEPGDTTVRTGRWVRVRQVTITAKHLVRDSVDEALDSLPVFVSHAVQEAAW